GIPILGAAIPNEFWTTTIRRRGIDHPDALFCAARKSVDKERSIGGDPGDAAVTIFGLNERRCGSGEGRGQERYLIALWHSGSWISLVQRFHHQQRRWNIGAPVHDSDPGQNRIAGARCFFCDVRVADLAKNFATQVPDFGTRGKDIERYLV